MESLDSSIHQGGTRKTRPPLAPRSLSLRSLFRWQWEPPDSWILKSVLRVTNQNGEAIGSATYLGQNSARSGIVLTDDHVVRPEVQISHIVSVEFEGVRVEARIILRPVESQNDTALLEIEAGNLKKLLECGLRAPALSWSFENSRVVLRAGSREDGSRFRAQRIWRVLTQLPKVFLHELEWGRSPNPGAAAVMFGWDSSEQPDPVVYANLRPKNSRVQVSFENNEKQRCLYFQFNKGVVMRGMSGGAVVDVVNGSLLGTIEGREMEQLFSEDGRVMEIKPGGGLAIPLNDFFNDFKQELRYFKRIKTTKRLIRLSIPTALVLVVLVMLAGSLRTIQSASETPLIRQQQTTNEVIKPEVASLKIDSVQQSGAYARVSGSAQNLPDGTTLEYQLSGIGSAPETGRLPGPVSEGKWEYARVPTRLNFQSGGEYDLQVVARKNSNPGLATDVQSNVKTFKVNEPRVIIQDCRVKEPIPDRASGSVEISGITNNNDRQEETIYAVVVGSDVAGNSTGRWYSQAIKDPQGNWTARVEVHSGGFFDAYARFSSVDPGEDLSQLGARRRCK
jgi:hypothetical protein